MADYATLLRDHVSLTCRSVARFFLQGYVPHLQSVSQICRLLRWQRRFPIPSSAAFGKIGDAYVTDTMRPSLTPTSAAPAAFGGCVRGAARLLSLVLAPLSAGYWSPPEW